MTLQQKTPVDSPLLKKTIVPKKHNTNWHEAAVCAVQIELRDYSHLLEYLTEYPLGKNSFRIDLLLIKKLSEQPIPKNIARIFKTFNLFEIKGLKSSVNTDCYYKTIGYAGLLVSQMGKTNQYNNVHISISFLCIHYPRALLAHLKKIRKLTVAEFSPGVYYIINEIFSVQIIVTSELSPDDDLYLRCLTNNLSDTQLVSRLIEDYKSHQEEEVYLKYMNQLANANLKKEGDPTMISEGLLKLCNSISDEIIARTKIADAKFYLPKIDALTAEVNYLKNLLEQHNIPFDSES